MSFPAILELSGKDAFLSNQEKFHIGIFENETSVKKATGLLKFIGLLVFQVVLKCYLAFLQDVIAEGKNFKKWCQN